MIMNGLYICGDLHNDVKAILKWNEYVENSVILQVGDLGWNAFDCFNVANKLAKKGNSLYAIRGNHCQLKFKGQTYGDNNNVKLLADYSVIEVNGLKILGIGGGISLDRRMRLEFELKYPHVHNYYDHDEAFKLHEGFLESVRNIDILVTHTAPNYLVPNLRPGFVEKFAQHDPNLMDDLELERKNWRKAFDILRENNDLKACIHGHFHVDYETKFEGVNIIGLGIDTVFEYQ